MHPESLHHYLSDAWPYLQHYGYAAVFLGILVEDFALPAPGESLLIAAAFLAAHGKLHIAPLLLLAWLGAVLGDNIGYALGRFGGRAAVLRLGRYFGLNAAHLTRVEYFFRHYGGWLVACARFVAVLRQLNGIVAGMAEMPWWRFLLFNTIGAALWVGVWGMGAYYLGKRIAQPLLLVKRYEPYVLVLGLVAIVAMIVYIFRSKRSEE
ncbi:MAG: DedA family protein [Sulfuriferula sp.]|nr:DedA family protein [Sulfuriferula sp.]